MDAKLTIEEHPEGRLRIGISINLSEKETELTKAMGALAHVDSPKPFPSQAYLCADPAMKMTLGTPKWNGVPQKSYFLPNARRVLLNRSIAGKTHLRIPIPGNLDLGFIPAGDETRITAWWKETKAAITEELQGRLYGVKAKGATTSTPVKTRELGGETINLNPLDPSETNGVRRRCLDI
jgi:hypothetical protein